MKPLVSILIPAYNAEKWIRQTLQSVVAQDYPKIEIILVDDGSQDRTVELARSFQSRNVKVIHQSNAGGPATRNRALALAQGDYIQWLDHDDLLAPNKISAQLKEAKAIQDDRVLFTCPFGVFYYRPEKAEFTPGPLWQDLNPLEYFFAKFSGNTYFQSSSWLVSRRLTQAAGPWWELRSPDDDGEYFCRVVSASKRIHFVPEAKCYWRVGSRANFSGAWKRSAAAQDATFKSMQRCIEHFRKLEDSPESRAACVKFLQDRLNYFYPESEGVVKRAQALAQELGGALSPPPLKWKYKWVRALFGPHAAKRVKLVCPELRTFVARNWDRAMYKLSYRPS